ncbi:transporter family-2 protein [Methylohalomonas lacus]|uniref:Transporter family-2 protein n=1 Tax=Methylohalomonas lacus TaxID=398773 RepID=A0AAE3HJI2_9GAMM|nr:DMT family transporter [Methylohalomonas lacus]MCS3902047.1 transporter family-2 protein [Methylohalomonas lacus]
MSSTATPVFLLISVGAGMLVPYQAAMNGLLSKYLHHPLQASAINFVGGALFLAVILLCLQPALPAAESLRKIPWYLFFGGMLGVLFVTGSLLAVPQIGGTAFLAAMLTGQMAGAVILDHFGFFDVPVQSVSLTRLGGLLLLALGVYLVQRG